MLLIQTAVVQISLSQSGYLCIHARYINCACINTYLCVHQTGKIHFDLEKIIRYSRKAVFRLRVVYKLFIWLLFISHWQFIPDWSPASWLGKQKQSQKKVRWQWKLLFKLSTFIFANYTDLQTSYLMAISIPGDKLVVNHICSSVSVWVFIVQSASTFPLPWSSDVSDPTVVLTIYSRHSPEKSHPLQ